MHDSSVIHSPLGKLKLIFKDERLHKIELYCRDDLSSSTTEISGLVSQQLNAYFDSVAHIFELDRVTQGSLFQQKVWGLLKKIPPGKVWTDAKIAKTLTSSAQAVGNACRSNPIPVIVACHRVASATGPGDFAGQTEGVLITIKKYLLKHEGICIE